MDYDFLCFQYCCTDFHTSNHNTRIKLCPNNEVTLLDPVSACDWSKKSVTLWIRNHVTKGRPQLQSNRKQSGNCTSNTYSDKRYLTNVTGWCRMRHHDCGSKYITRVLKIKEINGNWSENWGVSSRMTLDPKTLKHSPQAGVMREVEIVLVIQLVFKHIAELLIMIWFVLQILLV